MSDGSLKALRDLVTSTEAWQELCGLDPEDPDAAAEAAKRVGRYEATDLGPPIMMLADVTTGRRRDAVDRSYPRGTMVFEVELGRPDMEGQAEGVTEYDVVKGQIDGLVAEMEEAAGAPGALSVAEIRLDEAGDTTLAREKQRWFFRGEVDWPEGG